MGVSITIASGKGGVGKTMLTANLGVALSQLGEKVTILDADLEMANLGLHFGMERMNVTLHDVLAGEADISQAKYNILKNLDVIPAGVFPEKQREIYPKTLDEVLDGVLEQTDILIIDSPPVLGKNVINALSAGDYLLLVTTPEISSMSDAVKTKIVAGRLGCRTLGTVLNRVYSDNSSLNQKDVESVLETNVIAVIPEDPIVGVCVRLGSPVIIKNPDSPAAIAIKKLATILVGVQ